MSLLMLKTKDLTHQDHILNFELMLNPTGSGLLLNKHRGLESKRDKEKEICEVEKNFALRRFQIEKRLIERRQSRLMQRAAKRTYYTPRPFSTLSVREVEPAAEEAEDDAWSSSSRAHSAPQKRNLNPGWSGRQQFPKTGTQMSQKRDKFQRNSSFERRPKTATSPTGLRKQNTVVSGWTSSTCNTSNRNTQQTNTASSTSFRTTSERRSNVLVTSKAGAVNLTVSGKSSSTPFPRSCGKYSQQTPSCAQSETPTIPKHTGNTTVTFLTQSEADDQKVDSTGKACNTSCTEPDADSTNVTHLAKALQNAEANNKVIKGKIDQFLDKVEDFKTRPLSRDEGSETTSPWMITKRPKVTSATVAKRYNQLSLDMSRLHSAFDKLCVERNPDELQKIVKLASKLKSNVRHARNVSMVPVMGTIKSGKRFIENVLAKK